MNVDFRPNEFVSESLSFKPASNRLYRIGLCLVSVNEEPIRDWFHHPALIASILASFLALKIFTSLIDENNELMFVILGDWGHFLRIRLHLNIVFILLTMLSLLSQLIFWYNHVHQVEPTFLQPFLVVSGDIPPASVGLRNRAQVMAIINMIKWMFHLIEINNKKIILIMAFCVVTFSYLFTKTLTNTLIYGVPHAFFFMAYGHHLWNIMLYMIAYFVVICKYFKTKISNLNQSLVTKCSETNSKRLNNVFSDFDHLYLELNQYNSTYWSKFLLVLWLTLGSASVFLLYSTIFSSMVIWIRIVFIYVSIALMSIFLFVIFSASSVNALSKKTFRNFNDLMISYSTFNKRFVFTRITTKLKV